MLADRLDTAREHPLHGPSCGPSCGSRPGRGLTFAALLDAAGFLTADEELTNAQQHAVPIARLLNMPVDIDRPIAGPKRLEGVVIAIVVREPEHAVVLALGVEHDHEAIKVDAEIGLRMSPAGQRQPAADEPIELALQPRDVDFDVILDRPLPLRGR